jgi:hypothetical protein
LLLTAPSETLTFGKLYPSVRGRLVDQVMV